MATIRPRKKADGSVSYTAQLRIKKDGVQVYTERQTFAQPESCRGLAKRRENELSEPGAIERAQKGGVLLNDQYLQEVAHE